MNLPAIKTRFMRVVRVMVALSSAGWLAIGIICAVGEPKGFEGGIRNVLSGSQDLLLRHNEVRMMMMGENPYQLALDGTLEQRAAERLGPGLQLDPDYFPSTLLPVLLMAKLPFNAVKWLWLLVNLASVVLLVQTMRWMMQHRQPSTASQFLIICLWISGIPFWSCLAMGQASLFSMALTLAAFRADFQGRHVLAGVLLALGVFKYAVIWPLVLFFFILQWRWRSLLTAGGIHLVVHLIICRMIQANPVTIFADVLGCNSKVFHRDSLLTVWVPFRSWNRMFPDLALPAQVLGTLLLLSILGGLAWLWLRRKKDDRTNLVVWTAAFMLLAVLAVTSRIFAHMYVLPVLLCACVPAPMPLSPFRRVCLVLFALHLGNVPSGADDLGLPEHVEHWLMLYYNTILALLAVHLGWLLFKMERVPLQPMDAPVMRS